jgi:gliding motility-associated lipoprotein GldH
MIKGINKISFVLVLTSLLLLVSCNSNVIFTDSMEMKGKKWELFNVPVFRIPITDTLSSNNISFSIRTGSSYPFRNIYLFVTTTSPDGHDLTDTLQYNLSDEKGKRYGKGVGDIRELTLPYKMNIYFPLKGTYQIRIQHGMRIQDLKGIYDIGVRIEKAGK